MVIVFSSTYMNDKMDLKALPNWMSVNAFGFA
jgi:hypothetical protein